MKPHGPQPDARRGPAGASAPAAGAEPLPGAAADVRPFMERYVRQLTATGAIQSAEVERAFTAVERHRLLETFYYRPAGSAQAALIRHDPDRPVARHLAIIYADNALATRQAGGFPSSSTSQPSLMARMLEFLQLAQASRPRW
jgi:protein-L-isoaspartate O-methyltransferase